MASKKSEVAKKAESAVATNDYGDFAGAGFENVSASDLKIPFLGLLQGLSPQLKKDGIPGAQQGMLFNTVTNDLFDGDEGVEFIGAATEHCFVEWVPRDAGGGFRAKHSPISEVVTKAQAQFPFNELKTDPDPETGVRNDLVETFYIYGVSVGEAGVAQPIILAFKGTHIAAYRDWMSKLSYYVHVNEDGSKVPGNKLPLFAYLARVHSVEQKNNKGEFYNFDIRPAIGGKLKESMLTPDDERFQAAHEISQMFQKGQVSGDYAGQDNAKPSEPSGAAGDTTSEKPPF